MIYFVQQVMDMMVTSVTQRQKVNRHSCVAIPEIDMHLCLTGLKFWKNMKLTLASTSGSNLERDFLLSCCAWHQQQHDKMFSVINVSYYGFEPARTRSNALTPVLS